MPADEESLLEKKKFNHVSMDVINEWRRNHLYYFIRLTTADETLTTCIRCAVFDLISSINTYNDFYLQYNQRIKWFGHSGMMNSKY